jgi:glycosyltransferase involved in cell wall biosynthesis
LTSSTTITKSEDIGIISIITPVFNGEKYLRRCIDSVINQAYGNWELILIDDGSTDRTAAICDEYAAADHRIHVHHTHNSGPAAARNTGMDRATGKFYYFLDADDSIAPDALDLLANEYRKNKADLIVSGCKWLDGEGNVLREESSLDHQQMLSRQDILHYLESYLRKPNRTPMFTCVWGRLFNAAIIKNNKLRFNSELHVFEDADFNFKYLKFIRTMSYIEAHSYNYTYMVYYISASTKITDHPEKVFDHFKAMESLSELFLPERPGQTQEQIVGHACVSLTIIQLVRLCGQIKDGNRAEIMHLLQKMINEPMLRKSLPYYFPVRGESKLLPLLLKFKMAKAIMLVCRYKAVQRYGKPCETK